MEEGEKMTEETKELTPEYIERFPELKSVTKCDDCPIMWVCDKAKKGGLCHFELLRLKASTRKNKYLSSSSQKKFLAEIEETLGKYEEIIKYDAKPMKKDLLKLINIKLQLYEIMYSKTPQMATNIQINNDSTSMDIKKMMNDLQNEKEVIIEGDVVEEEKDI